MCPNHTDRQDTGPAKFSLYYSGTGKKIQIVMDKGCGAEDRGRGKEEKREGPNGKKKEKRTPAWEETVLSQAEVFAEADVIKLSSLQLYDIAPSEGWTAEPAEVPEPSGAAAGASGTEGVVMLRISVTLRTFPSSE